MWREIEKAIANDDWNAARLRIQFGLDEQPEDHWLLTRLALTYYEQFDYQRALELSGQALDIEPECPLALWDYAGALAMLDRPEEALLFYQRIIDRGIDSLAHDQCGEGRARARGFYADTLYRMSHCYIALDDQGKAGEMMRMHLRERGPGCQSIYPIATVRKEARALNLCNGKEMP